MSAGNAQLVRLQRNNVKLEVAAKPGMVTKFRDGQCSLQDALIDDRIFRNFQKGEVANQEELSKFEVTGNDLLALILTTGKFGLTAAEKKEATEKLHKEVVTFIHSNFIDSVSGKPHPITRIESALSESKATIDPDLDAEKNARKLIPKLQLIIRLRESVIEGVLKCPNNKLGQTVGICYNLGKVTREEYGPENTYLSMIVNPSNYDAFIEQTSRASQGLAVFAINGASVESETFEEKENTTVRKRAGKGGRK